MSGSTKNNIDVTEITKNFLLGGVSGVVAKTTCAPLERVKVVLQVGNASSGVKYNGFFDAFNGIVRNQGVTGLWKGNFINCIRYFPTQALNFGFKTVYSQAFPISKDASYIKNFMSSLGLGGAVGASTLTLVMPLEYLTTRMMADTGATKQFNGIADCVRKTYASEGLKGFYKGYFPSVAGIIVYRAGYFGLWDQKKVLEERFNITYSNGYVKFMSNFAVALVIDIISALAAYPADSVRRSLMMTSGEAVKPFEGTKGCIQYLYNKGGVGAFYKGAMTNNIRAIGSALVLVLYDQFKGMMDKPKSPKSV